MIRPKLRYGVIYKISNNYNNKIYIGQTTNTSRDRWDWHIWSAEKGNNQGPLYVDIRIFGPKSFSIEDLYIAFTRDELDKAEISFIEEYNSGCPVGYNLTLGGFPGAGKFSDVLKKRMSAIMKEVTSSLEYKEQQRQNTIRQFANPENREKQRLASLRQFADPNKRKIHKDSHNTEEYKKLISDKMSNTVWINNGSINKRIKSNIEIPEGWNLGVLNYGAKEGSMSRQEAQLLGKHVRWHVNRNIINFECKFCLKETN